MDEAKASAPMRLFNAYEGITRLLAGTTMGVIVLIMVVQVVARYVFNASLIWAEELCRYILVWQTFLFIGYAYQRGELVILDLFSTRVPPLVYMAIRIVTAVPISIFLYLIISAGIGHALRFSAQTIPAIDFIWMSITGEPARVPVFWVYVAVPLGCSILLVHYLARLGHDAWCVATGRSIQTPASTELMT